MKVINVIDEDEPLTAHIDTRVHAGVIVHHIQFLPTYTEDETGDFEGLELDPEAGREF